MAGSLQTQLGVHSTLAAVIALAAAPGCFYLDPLNQRPSLAIDDVSGPSAPRGGVISLTANVDDPNDSPVALQWNAYACAGATADASTCDPAPVATATTAGFELEAPFDTASSAPARAVLITLDGVDAAGAAAHPEQTAAIALTDAPPTLALALTPRPSSYVVGYPIDAYAKVGDPDDGPNHVTVAWSAYSPSGVTPLTTSATTPLDAEHVQLAAAFTPGVAGQWSLQATATDPLGAQTEQSLGFEVAADQPPCLESWVPAVPPGGDALPIDAATLFEVLVVDDDLDPWPPVTAPVPGATTFAWSLLPPGATARELLASATGPSVALDPASYSPGDVAELRVEIFDRAHTAPLPCADADATCSLDGSASCNQRLTWRVEMQ